MCFSPPQQQELVSSFKAIPPLFQEKTGRIPYKAIASYFGIEDTNGFSSLCKSVGQNSLESIRAMLTDCGFTGFDDIVQQIKKGI